MNPEVEVKVKNEWWTWWNCDVSFRRRSTSSCLSSLASSLFHPWRKIRLRKIQLKLKLNQYILILLRYIPVTTFSRIKLCCNRMASSCLVCVRFTNEISGSVCQCESVCKRLPHDCTPRRDTSQLKSRLKSSTHPNNSFNASCEPAAASSMDQSGDSRASPYTLVGADAEVHRKILNVTLH